MDASMKLQRLADLGRQAASATDAARFLQSLADTMRSTFSARSVAVVLVAEDSDLLSVKVSSGIADAVARDWRKPVGTGNTAEVLRSGASVLLDRVDPATPGLAEFVVEHTPASLLCVPLLADGRALGFVLAESEREGAFTEGDVPLAKLAADLAALVISREILAQASRKLVMMDPLTQVYSYAYFHRRLSEEVERATRLNESLSVLLVEIDHLKDHRDANGWQATEKVLRDLVKLVSTSVRNIDVVGRYGVGEIILYLPETPRDKACLAAERIRGLIEKGTKTVPATGLTVSIGLASLPENGETVTRLIESATSALLAAERGGRNRVQPAATGATP